MTNASATPKGDGSSSKRDDKVSDRASKRGKRSSKSSRGDVVGDGGACAGSARERSMGEMFIDKGDKWV